MTHAAPAGPDSPPQKSGSEPSARRKVAANLTATFWLPPFGSLPLLLASLPQKSGSELARRMGHPALAPMAHPAHTAPGYSHSIVAGGLGVMS